jgi:hypothetical protein
MGSKCAGALFVIRVRENTLLCRWTADGRLRGRRFDDLISRFARALEVGTPPTDFLESWGYGQTTPKILEQ